MFDFNEMIKENMESVVLVTGSFMQRILLKLAVLLLNY